MKIISFMSLIFVMNISYSQEMAGPESGGDGPFQSPEQ